MQFEIGDRTMWWPSCRVLLQGRGASFLVSVNGLSACRVECLAVVVSSKDRSDGW